MTEEELDALDEFPKPPWRPTKYDPAFCERVVEMGMEGKSKVEIAVALGVGRATIKVWEAKHDAFRAAMAYAKDCEQSWWEAQGRMNLGAQHFQASMWSRSMAARFSDDWRERKDIDLNGTLQVTEIKRTIVDPRDTDT
jgi:hypothetical protein